MKLLPIITIVSVGLAVSAYANQDHQEQRLDGSQSISPSTYSLINDSHQDYLNKIDGLGMLENSRALNTPVIGKTTRYFTDAELVDLIKSDGYDSVKIVDEGVISLEIGDRRYALFNKDNGYLQLYYAVKTDAIDYKDINEWNRTMNLSRAYLDDAMDPVIEADLLFKAGLQEAHISYFISEFLRSADDFRQFLKQRADNK